jgi:carbon monoxide dehydrogenase subunit G
MEKVETSISIGRPIEEVFAFLTDLENQKSMSPAITEVAFSGKVAVGTKFIIKSKYGNREFSTENEIVALELNKTFAMKTFAPPPASPVTSTYTLEKDGSGTKLHLSMDAPVMPGTEGLVVPQLRAGLDMALAAIKKAIGG